MKKAKKAIIIIIALLVILGGTFAILWFFTPVFNFLKPASDNFSLQVKKLFGEKEEVSYEDYLASIEKLKVEDTSYVTDAKISMNVALPSDIIDSKTQKMLNSSSVECKGSYDSGSKAISSNIALLYDGKEMLNLNTIVDGKKLSISSKEFYDKAITFDMDKYKDFCRNNNIDVSEDEIKEIEEYFKIMESAQSNNSSDFIYNLMYLTEDEYKAINKNYGNLLTTLIDDDKYTSQKNQKITVGGEEIKADAYTLTVSAEDVYNYIKKLAEMAKDDDNLKTILTKKINLVKDYVVSTSKLAESDDSQFSASISSIEDIKESDLEDLFSKFIDALEDSEDIFSSIEGVVKFTIYSDKKSKNPVRLDIAIADDEEDEGTVILSEEIEDGKTTYTIDVGGLAKKMGASSSVSIPKIIIVDKHEKTDTSKKGEVTVSMKAAGREQSIAVINYEKVNSDTEFKNNIKIKSDLAPSLNIDMKIEATGLNKKKQDYVIDIDASVPVQMSTYKVGFNMEGSIEYGKSDIEKLDSSNSVDFFSKSKEECQTIIREIVTKASDILPAKLSKYGQNITKEDILKIIPAEPTAPVVPEVPVEGTTQNTEPVQPAA